MGKETSTSFGAGHAPSASIPQAARRPRSKASIGLRIVTATCISLVFIYLFATHLHLAQLATMLGRIDSGWLIAGILVLGAANLIRSDRFKLLDGRRHGLGYWWVTTQIYNLTTSTLPGGLGEIATAYLFRRSSFVGWAGAFRLLVIARLIDLATLLSIFVGAMWVLGLAWTSPSGIVSCGVSAALVLVALVLLLPRTQTAALFLVARLMPTRFSMLRRMRATVESLVETAKEVDRGGGLRVVLWSAGMGVLSASVVTVLLNGFGQRLGLLQSFAAYGLYVVLQLIPLQGIAGVGTQSARWTIALVVVGVPAQQAGIDGVALYVCLYGIVALWALLAALYAVLLRLRHGAGAPDATEHDKAAEAAETSKPIATPVSMRAHAQDYLFLDRDN